MTILFNCQCRQRKTLEGRHAVVAGLPNHVPGPHSSVVTQSRPRGLVPGYWLSVACLIEHLVGARPRTGFESSLGRGSLAHDAPAEVLTSHTPCLTEQLTPRDTSCPSHRTHSSRHNRYRLRRHKLASIYRISYVIWSRPALSEKPDVSGHCSFHVDARSSLGLEAVTLQAARSHGHMASVIS